MIKYRIIELKTSFGDIYYDAEYVFQSGFDDNSWIPLNLSLVDEINKYNNYNKFMEIDEVKKQAEQKIKVILNSLYREVVSEHKFEKDKI